MKRSYFLITGASLFLLTSTYAEDPIQLMENLTLNEESSEITSSVIDEELALLDEQMEEFENEILALEEEIKKDAESFEMENKEAVAVEVPSAEIEPATENLIEETSIATAPLEQVQTETELALEEPQQQLETSPVIEQEPIHETLAVETPKAVEAQHEVAVLEEVPQIQEAPAVLNVDSTKAEKKNDAIEVNIDQAFAGSPIIYTILFGMSVFALCVWLYNLLTLRKSGSVSDVFVKNVKNKLNSNHFDDALSLCQHHENLLSKMVVSGINARRHGLPVMIEAMKAEGKRASVHFWQRIGLLNDIAIIAPMIGLLGTVLGMFYAFYDINRSIESISTLFDGLGVSVGTTVAGLIVAILALILHSIAKYRLVKMLATVENEAQALATLIDDRTSEYKG